MLAATACSVPDIQIVEQDHRPVSEQDASANEPDTRTRIDASTSIETSPVRGAGGRDSVAGAAGSGVGAGEAGSAGPTDAGRGGESGAGAGGAGSGAGGTDAAAPAAAGTPAPSGEPDSGTPMQPVRACAVWLRVNLRDTTVPAGAVEGGLETVAGSPTRQYVCRARPNGSTYTVPGKWIPGLGCYVAYRSGSSIMQFGVLDGMVDVLTASPGCSFSWRTASDLTLPPNAIDLGDPAGGPHYACHGYYSSIASAGTQIGVVIPSTDTPPKHQCWFQSFVGTSQPQNPTQFEVLAQDSP